MRGYAAKGAGADALEKARRYLAGLFPLGLESHEALAEQIADALLDGLGLEHVKTYRSRVLAVTAAKARAMAAELSPAREGALLIAVGEADVARKALDGLCPIDVRQLEEFG
jgi:zinc protease